MSSPVRPPGDSDPRRAWYPPASGPVVSRGRERPHDPPVLADAGRAVDPVAHRDWRSGGCMRPPERTPIYVRPPSRPITSSTASPSPVSVTAAPIRPSEARPNECLHRKRRASECPRSEIMSAGPRSPLISAIGLDPGDPRLLELWDAAGIRLRAPDDVVHGFSCLERLAHRPNELLPFGR